MFKADDVIEKLPIPSKNGPNSEQPDDFVENQPVMFVEIKKTILSIPQSTMPNLNQSMSPKRFTHCFWYCERVQVYFNFERNM